MRYFKLINNNYIDAVGTGEGGTAITEQEYNEILEVIKTKPSRTATTDYRLKSDLTWEKYEHDTDPDPEPTESDKAEAYDILMGVSE